MSDFIDLKIGSGNSEGRVKIKVFNLNIPTDSSQYENLLNNEHVTILEESTPSVDKMGRVLIIVKWRE